MTTPKQKQPLWWLQLVDSTCLENHEEVRKLITTWDVGATWEDSAHRLDLVWDAASTMPTSISACGFEGHVPDLEHYLHDIQPLLSEREYMIFLITLNHVVIDRRGVRVMVVTPRIVAEVSGMELIERARRVVLASEEELLNPEETP